MKYTSTCIRKYTTKVTMNCSVEKVAAKPKIGEKNKSIP